MDIFDIEPGQLDRFTAPGHYRVRLEHFTLEMYFQPAQQRRCLVFSPGFLNTADFPYPYFQRVSWLRNFDAVGISLADPTLSLSREVGIGWFIGNRQSHFLTETAAFLRSLLIHLGIPSTSTLFFGSSAGGFSSIGLAANLPGAQAFSVNPQTDITRFHSVTEMYRTFTASFGSAGNIEALKKAYGSRLDLIETMRAAGHVPPITIWQNTHDGYHYDNHLMPFLSRLPELTPKNEARVILTSDAELGHNPPALPRLRSLFDGMLAGM